MQITKNHSIDKRNKVSFTCARVRIITWEGLRRLSRETWLLVPSFIFLEQRTYVKYTQDTFSLKFQRGIQLQKVGQHDADVRKGTNLGVTSRALPIGLGGEVCILILRVHSSL